MVVYVQLDIYTYALNCSVESTEQTNQQTTTKKNQNHYDECDGQFLFCGSLVISTTTQKNQNNID